LPSAFPWWGSSAQPKRTVSARIATTTFLDAARLAKQEV